MISRNFKITFALLFITAACVHASDWKVHGKDNHNTRYDGTNAYLNSYSAQFVQNAWNFTATGFITGTPSIKGNIAYFCDFPTSSGGGNLYAIDISNSGALVWVKHLATDSGVAGDYCRATPALVDDLLFIGSQKSGHLYKYNALTGVFLGKVLLNPHRFAIVTMGGTIHGDYIYIGVASEEELMTAFIPGYVCCSFVGTQHAVNIHTLAILWTREPWTANHPRGVGGLSGIGYWGSSPVIDVERGTVYVATGNPYQLPDAWEACQIANITSSTCIPADVLFNAVIAYDLFTGETVWSRKLSHFDDWNVDCLLPPPFNENCPIPSGQDADFGMAPSMTKNSTCDDVLVIGQKNGAVWSLNPDNGEVLHGIFTGPWGTLGGHSWGGALDSEKYYVADINSFHFPWPLGPPASVVSQRGWWSKIDINTFNIDCQIEVPDSNPIIAGTSAIGPPTLVNDLLIVTSTNPTGNQVHLIDTTTCTIVKSLSTGVTIYGGVSVSDKCFFVGTGYKPLYNPLWSEGEHKLFAFCLP